MTPCRILTFCAPAGKGPGLPSLPPLPFSPSVRANRILAALPVAELTHLRNHLEFVDLPKGQMLCEAGTRFEWLYFPVSGIVSLLHVMADGSAAETAVIGNDGMVGISLLVGGDSATSCAVVQQCGQAYRIRAKHLKSELSGNAKLLQLGQRYAQALQTQMAQTIVCNRHHTLEQQLCRWLLLRFDLLAGEALAMTQEQIANALGVRREGVTEAAGRLQGSGLISYSRGRIVMLDFAALQQRVCECHATVRREYQRLLHGQL